MAKYPTGGNWKDIPLYLLKGQKAKFSNFHRKLHPDKPCYTIGKEEHFSSGRFYHYNEPRYITDKELKILHSYPESFKFIGNSKEIHARIGNSVPSLMMKSIGEHVKINMLKLIC